MDTDTAYRLYQNERRRERYATDPEYRAKRIQISKDERARKAELRRERYRTDPEYRARRLSHKSGASA